MELRIEPSEYFKTSPFTINIDSGETVENLYYTISLSITNIPVSEMELVHNGKILRSSESKIINSGIVYGDRLELNKRSSKCCSLL